jgi:hypothetical protein
MRIDKRPPLVARRRLLPVVISFLGDLAGFTVQPMVNPFDHLRRNIARLSEGLGAWQWPRFLARRDEGREHEQSE